MVSVSSNYTQQVQQTPQASQAAGSSAASIMPSASQSVENKNTSRIDTLLEELCAKNGLDFQAVKNSGIIYRVSGMNEEELQNADEETIRRIINCIEEAVKESPDDLSKAGKIANDYYNAITYGAWDSIKAYKAAAGRNNEDINSRMERFFGIKNFSSLPKEQIENYLERYFNEFFTQKIKEGKNPEEIAKLQRQDFVKLVNNTPDEQKSIFKEAIHSLLAQNRIKGVKSVLLSFATDGERTKYSNLYTTEDYEKLALKPDIQGNTPDSNEITETVSEIVKWQDVEHIQANETKLQTEAVQFFKDNADILQKIAEKEAKGIELTDEEKAVKEKVEKYFTAVKAGEFSGTAINKIINEEMRDEILSKMNNDALSLPNYKKIIEKVNEYIESNKDISKDDVKAIIHTATNGNSTALAKNPDAEIVTQESAEQYNQDYGFALPQNDVFAEQLKLEKLRKDVCTQDDTPEFSVQKKKEEKPVSEYVLRQQAQSGSMEDIKIYLKKTNSSAADFAKEVFTSINQASNSAKTFAFNFFERSSHAVQNLFLITISSSLEGMKEAAKLTDLSNFNLTGVSVTTQKAIDKIQERFNPSSLA